MIIYNITTKVHHSIDKLWLQWQKEENMPQQMETGLFVSNKLFRLLDQDDTEGNTYAVQYTAATPEDYNTYIKEYAPALRKKATQQWGDKIISFHSALEVIH